MYAPQQEYPPPYTNYGNAPPPATMYAAPPQPPAPQPMYVVPVQPVVQMAAPAPAQTTSNVNVTVNANTGWQTTRVFVRRRPVWISTLGVIIVVIVVLSIFSTNS